MNISHMKLKYVEVDAENLGIGDIVVYNKYHVVEYKGTSPSSGRSYCRKVGTEEISALDNDFWLMQVVDGEKEIDILPKQYPFAFKLMEEGTEVEDYYEFNGFAVISTSCTHPGFITESRVGRLTTEEGEVTSWIAEVEIYCAHCYKPMLFKAPMGMSPDQPMTSADRTELRIPIEPCD